MGFIWLKLARKQTSAANIAACFRTADFFNSIPILSSTAARDLRVETS